MATKRRPKTREQIVANIRRTRDGMIQILNDQAAWNANRGDQHAVEVDHDGQMRRWVEAADEFLDAEDRRPLPKMLALREAR